MTIWITTVNYHGFGYKGERSISENDIEYFSSEEAAKAYIDTIVQPTGYHGSGCEYKYKIYPIELSDGKLHRSSKHDIRSSTSIF